MKNALLAAALTAAVSTGAQAAVFTFEFGLPIAESTTEIDQTGFLGLFDSSLGTLTAAVLNISGEATTTLTLVNNATTTVTSRANSFMGFDWTSGLPALDAILAGTEDLGIAFTTGNPLQYTAGQSRSFGPLEGADARAYNLAGILPFLSSPGGGTFSLNCTTLTGVTILGGGGNIASSQVTTAGCGASIEYTYTPTTQVPEPATLALLGLAVGGAGFAARRGRR